MNITKDLEGYEGLYKISSTGKVYSMGNGNSTNPQTKIKRELTINVTNNGYTKVKLSKNGKRQYVSMHRLVATNFLLNPDNKPQVNHKDGNKLNNDVSNLEWVTAKENCRHSVDNGLYIAPKGIKSKCSKQIEQLSIDGSLIKIWGSINEVKRELGFNSFGIIKCCKKEKKYKTAYGYKWNYV